MATFDFNIDHASVPFNTLPEATQSVLVSWVMTALEGRVSSMSTSEVKKLIVNGTDRNSSDVKTPEVRTWVETHTDRWTAFQDANYNTMVGHIMAGTVPTRGDGRSQVEIDTRDAAKRLLTVLFADYNKRNGLEPGQQGALGFKTLAKGKGASKDANEELRQENESAIDTFLATHAAEGGKYHARFVKALAAVRAEHTRTKNNNTVVNTVTVSVDSL